MKRQPATPATRFLGIEAGGTRTVAIWENDRTGETCRLEAGPANLRLMTDLQLVRHLKSLSEGLPRPDALAIGMAGARLDQDRTRIRRAAARAWPRVPCVATHDLDTALAAASGPETDRPTVLVLSGTGSCCFGRAPDGEDTAKIGGWGHLLGDKGSAYEIGLRGLKAVVYYLDRDRAWPALGRSLLAHLQLNEPDDLIPWAQAASKSDIASLAKVVFEAWSQRDRIARDILTGARHSLSKDAVQCARQLAAKDEPVHFVLAGGVLLKQPRFARLLKLDLKKAWPNATVETLVREGAAGAIMLARRSVHARPELPRASAKSSPSSLSPDTSDLAKALTEQRHPKSMHLDRMPVGEAIELMLREDAGIPRALLAEKDRLERGVSFIVNAFRRGGRLFYVGAGTSGRLGVLDASECPPTFQSPPEQVQGIMAGGAKALWQAVEGAEDDMESGARAIEGRGAEKNDVVVGIAASGRTPFVWGALREARRRGAKTVLLTFNPALKLPANHRPHLLIAPRLGPEILTGSTRLKAGTATKLVLNIFTTLAMVRTGKVLGNLMIDVKATNVKLRDRATRMVQVLTGASWEDSRAALRRSQWNVRRACARLGDRKYSA